jgi:cytochrome c peroxidase
MGAIGSLRPARQGPGSPLMNGLPFIRPIRDRVLTAAFVVLWTLGAVVSVRAGGGDWNEEALARIRSVPLGLPEVPIPPENPPTVDKIALGRRLFFDRRLSFNGTMSCGMCHIPEQGFTNNELATPIGVEGRSLRRNAPTVLNAAYARHIFHDGRDTSLETQTVNPILAHDEMAAPSPGWLLARIEDLSDYDGMFEQAFGGRPSLDRIGKAIASWERTLLAAESPFDRWRYGGEEDALTEEQERGFALFTGEAHCERCHTIGDEHALFTDQSFHDTGIGYHRTHVAPRSGEPVPVEVSPGVVIPMDRDLVRSVGNDPLPDLGRFEVTLDPEDRWRFKTPTLRNVALTAPYMHDGSLRTLEEVVRFYSRGGVPHDGLDPLILPLHLDDREIDALVAFLESLTSPDVAELQADARSVPVGN